MYDPPRCPKCRWYLEFYRITLGRWTPHCHNPTCSLDRVTTADFIMTFIEEGLSVVEMARRLNVTVSAIYQASSRKGIRFPRSETGRFSSSDPITRERMRKYTDEELLQYLRLLAAKRGKNTVSVAYYCKPINERYPRATYIHRWGTWNNALVAAGLEPGRATPKGFGEATYSDEDWNRAYLRIKLKAARVPTVAEWHAYRQQGEPSEYIARAKFGTWSKFLNAMEQRLSD